MDYAINILFFAVIGTLEAFLWHYSVNKISRVTAKRLHYPLVVIRLIWFGWLLLKNNYDYGSIVPLFCCYPFIHLGVMYQVRHWLNGKVYQYGFFSNASASSTSILDRLLPLDAWMRTAMFVFGTFTYILWNSL